MAYVKPAADLNKSFFFLQYLSKIEFCVGLTGFYQISFKSMTNKLDST